MVTIPQMLFPNKLRSYSYKEIYIPFYRGDGTNMVFEKFSEGASQFSIEDAFRGDFSSFLPLVYLTISIAIYSILIWHFYRFIAKRDIFKFSPKKPVKKDILNSRNFNIVIVCLEKGQEIKPHPESLKVFF
jgi:hypothetical protein